MSRRWRQGRT